MPNLFDLIPEEEKQRSIANYKRRTARGTSQPTAAVPPEVYILSELAFYYGWEAMVAARQGYFVYCDVVDGERVWKKSALTLEEVLLMVDGARKVRNKQLAQSSNLNYKAYGAAMNSENFEQYKTAHDNLINDAEVQSG